MRTVDGERAKYLAHVDKVSFHCLNITMIIIIAHRYGSFPFPNLLNFSCLFVFFVFSRQIMKKTSLSCNAV